MLWKLLPKLLLRFTSDRRVSYIGVGELHTVCSVTLLVLNSLLVNTAWLWEVSRLSHVVNHLKVFCDLLGLGQARLIGHPSDLSVEVVFFLLQADVGSRSSVEVDSLVI